MQLDLNLLTALDALLVNGSVGGAADQLELSAPAMSRTLGRIRRTTGDQIMVRTGRTMTPTPYAESIRDEVHELVRRAHTALRPDVELDLATLDRTFTLRANAAVVYGLGTRLVANIRKHAPNVTLRILAEPSSNTVDLRQGLVDLEISASKPELPEHNYEVIGEDKLVAVFRSRHPIGNKKLTPKRFAEADHIMVSRRGRVWDLIDEHLEHHELTRRVVASAPTSEAALDFVSETDLVVVVPGQMCRHSIESLGLESRELPFRVTAPQLLMIWHQRSDDDRAHAWLRDQFRTAAAEIYGKSPSD
jgi:DNA-binding transcriptional LysR family regulator